MFSLFFCVFFLQTCGAGGMSEAKENGDKNTQNVLHSCLRL